MSLTRWDPFREMLSWRDAMNRMFDESLSPFRSGTFGTEGLLSVDMYETEDNVVISTPLPGVKPEDVDISVTGNMLTIRGEVKAEDEKNRGNVYYQERRYGAFQRSIALPRDVDVNKIEAEFENGVLRLTVPKTEEAKPKQIQIKSKGEGPREISAGQKNQ